MTPLLLATVLTCNQVMTISDRIVRNTNLTFKQRIDLFLEIKKTIPTCPIYIDPLDPKQIIKLHQK
jgi:hypothetical protein